MKARYLAIVVSLAVAVSAGAMTLQAMGAPASPQPLDHAAPRGERLFASIWGANYIAVADAATLREIRKIPADNDGPATLYPTTDDRRLYLENGGYRGRTVSIIDPGAMVITHQVTISGANGDRAARIQRDGRYYYVSTIPQGDVTQIDTRTEKVTRVYPGIGNDFTAGRDGATLFEVRTLGKRPSLVAIDTATGKTVGSVSWAPAAGGFLEKGFGYTLMSEDGNFVYLSANPVRAIDVRDRTHPRLAASIPVGLGPLLPGLTPDGSQLWVPNAGEGTISVIDTASLKVVRTIRTGRYMTHIAFSPDGARAYVAEARAGGPRPRPILLASLYLVKMGLGGLFGDEHGVYAPRPLLDTPGEVVAYDARTYRKLDLPPLQTVSVPSFLAVVPAG